MPGRNFKTFPLSLYCADGSAKLRSNITIRCRADQAQFARNSQCARVCKLCPSSTSFARLKSETHLTEFANYVTCSTRFWPQLR